MKNLFLALGLSCVLLVACNNNSNKKAVENKNNKQETCSGKHHQKCEMTPEQKAECEAFMTKWNNWANLSVDEQKALVAEAKAKIDNCEAAKKAKCEGKCDHKDGQKCEGKCDHKDGQKCEGKCDHKDGKKCEGKCDNLTPEQIAAKQAQCAEMKAKWAAFETLTLEEQKALIDQKMNCKKSHRQHCGAPKDGQHKCGGNCDKAAQPAK